MNSLGQTPRRTERVVVDDWTSWSLLPRSSNQERRQLRRVEASFEVRVAGVERDFEGINISLAGVLFLVDDWTLEDSRQKLELNLPGVSKAIGVSARAIAYAEHGGKRAIRMRFQDLDSKSLKVLSRWMTARLH